MIVRPTTFFGGKPFKNEYSMLHDGVDEYINVTSLPLNTQVTWSTWVKLISAGNYPMIISSVAAGIYHELRFLQDTRRPEVLFNFNNLGYSNVSSPDAINLNVWYNILLSFDGTTLILYVNAVNKASSTSTYTSPSSFHIGRRQDGGFNLNGNIDEVSVWNVGFNNAEASELFNNGNPNDLLAHSRAANLKFWSRQGDGATYSGGVWTFPDASNSGAVIQSVNMEETDRVTDVP